MWDLRVFVYGEHSEGLKEITDRISGLRMRASLHGGLEMVEFRIGDDFVDARRWAFDNINSKIFVVDNLIVPPVAEAVILEPGFSFVGNQIRAFGPWLAYMFSRPYNDTRSWLTAGTTTGQIIDIMTECPGISGATTYIQETSTNHFPWQTVDNKFPGDLIEFLASLSDANNRAWYFYLTPSPFWRARNMDFGYPIAHFVPEDSIVTTYRCSRADMSARGITVRPSLRDLVNDVRVMWRDSEGVTWQTPSAIDTASQTRYGTRRRWDFDLGKATEAAANQYRDLLLQKHADFQQAATFELNGTIFRAGCHGCQSWDAAMLEMPLWRLIADFPVRFTISDIIEPDAMTWEQDLDNRTTFITTAAEYIHDENILTIMPDTQEGQADAMLARYRGLQ